MDILKEERMIPVRSITNSCGTFWVQDDGTLQYFECAEENYYRPYNDPNYRNEKHLHRLEIPEGVTGLPAGSFDGYHVFSYSPVTMPETLTALGDAAGGVFRNFSASGLELPKGIRFVGEDSFFISTIGEIRISDDMDARTVQVLARLFENHTYHFFLFYPGEKTRDLPPLQVPTIQLRNESGTFYVDKLGVLQAFRCSPENNADHCSEPETKRLYKLHIPEGVTVLKEEAFRHYTVLEELTFPDSLMLMGTGYGCALANCSLPDVVIPETLRILGTFAFGCSALRSLRLPENAAWEYARQFKGSQIGTLYLSQKYREKSNDSGIHRSADGQGYLHSLLVNDIRIGKIVWLE